jgi:hypothetical protein
LTPVHNIATIHNTVKNWGIGLAEAKKTLSQIVPVLIAALVSDVAVSDRSTGKISLIGIFDRIFVGKFPTERPLSLYMKLTDAEGHYEIDIKYIQLKTSKVLAGLKGEFDFRDRLASSDLHISFPPLPIPEEGRYEFQIWANSVFLGSAFIDAVESPKV